jgi:hypothetical protein
LHLSSENPVSNFAFSNSTCTAYSPVAIFDDATRQHSGSQHKHVVAQVIADLKVELELQIDVGEV